MDLEEVYIFFKYFLTVSILIFPNELNAYASLVDYTADIP
jgi:hypothetical protein